MHVFVDFGTPNYVFVDFECGRPPGRGLQRQKKKFLLILKHINQFLLIFSVVVRLVEASSGKKSSSC